MANSSWFQGRWHFKGQNWKLLFVLIPIALIVEVIMISSPYQAGGPVIFFYVLEYS